MERLISSILALGLIFGTFSALAAPKGSPYDYALQTKYLCYANGVVVQNKQKIVSNGRALGEVSFVAHAGRNQTLTFRRGTGEYIIWPRVAHKGFGKSLNILSRKESGDFMIVQEIDMGDSQRTKTSINLSIKDEQEEARQISCRIELEWLKKVK